MKQLKIPRSWMTAVLLAAVSVSIYGCYDGKLPNPYESAFSRVNFISTAAGRPAGAATVTGTASNLFFDNYFSGFDEDPGLRIQLNPGNQKVTITPGSLQALGNGALYELWAFDGSVTPSRYPISMGKFNLDGSDNLVMYDLNGENPFPTNATSFLMSQIGVPAGAAYTWPIDLSAKYGAGNTLMVLTVESPTDRGIDPSATRILEAKLPPSGDVVMRFPKMSGMDTVKATGSVSTVPSGSKNGTLTIHFENLPDVAASGFIFEAFAVKDGSYISGKRFKSDGGTAIFTVSSDFALDLTAAQRIEVTLEPEPDFSGSTFPFIAARANILKNSMPNSLLTILPQNLERLGDSSGSAVGTGSHYELWINKGGVVTSLGKFDVRADSSGLERVGAGNSNTFNSGIDLSLASEITITVEPAGDIDATPSVSALLKGTLSGTSSVNMAFPADFSTLSAVASLGTQPGGPINGYASVQLKGLPDLKAKGFRYEGWIVREGKYTSAGKFDSQGVDKVTTFEYHSTLSLMTADSFRISVEPMTDSEADDTFPFEILRYNFTN